MPNSDDKAMAPRKRLGRAVWRIWLAWPAATLVAMPLWLGACAPVEPPPRPAATYTGPPAAAVEPTPGPIALAPSITGTPVPISAPARAPAVAPPEPLPPLGPATALATPAPSPAPLAPADALPVVPAAAVEPPAALSPCPPGQIATLSKPDMAGTPVLLCRRAPPPR